jgi:CoA:oxalate CoA-transferase
LDAADGSSGTRAAREADVPGGDMLQGVTVLDFTRVLAGPYCTRLLADLGARVIKIERPGRGDDMRAAPLQIDPARLDQSTYFVRVNAGKLSVAVDLTRPEGRAVALDLVGIADVLVENFVPGVMTRLGLDYRAAAVRRPGLVYCSISGYGQTGPWRERPAMAHVIHATSGVMDLERHGDAAPGVMYIQAADVLAGTHAFGAIAAALVRRSRTGAGAHLDVSMLEALIAAEDISLGSVLNAGPAYAGPRSGMLVHRVGGQWLALQTVGVLDLWPRLLALLQRPDLAEDPRFATPVARREHWPEIRAIVTDWLDRFRTAAEALAALEAARIPCARVLSPAEVVSAPHLAERGAFPAVPHPTRGEVRVTASPFHVDGRPTGPAGPAPYEPGEHTRAVLADLLGYDAERIAQLARRGILAGRGLDDAGTLSRAGASPDE